MQNQVLGGGSNAFVNQALRLSGWQITVTVACGKSEEEKAAEDRGGQGSSRGAQEPLVMGTTAASKGLQDFAKAMEGAAAA